MLATAKATKPNNLFKGLSMADQKMSKFCINSSSTGYPHFSYENLQPYMD